MIAKMKPPDLNKEAIRARMEGKKLRMPFSSLSQPYGKEFLEPQYLKGKVLDEWTMDRAVRPYKAYEKFVKGPDGKKVEPYTFSAHASACGSPSLDSLGQQHREWIQGHMDQREKYLFPVYYDQKKQQAIKARKERELQQQQLSMTDPSPPDPAILRRQETRKVQAMIRKAKQSMSSPDLFTGVKHIDVFRYNNRTAREFSTEAPWQLFEEGQQCEKAYVPFVRKGFEKERAKRGPKDGLPPM
mmetsp:Transcript_57062/g.152471  ORF Transcript_57062/g.152471 Transcript_57062/m.152471 type:complete len:243 (-) Transcript_57062:144-872(-)